MTMPISKPFYPMSHAMTMTDDNGTRIIEAVEADAALWSDFLALCDCGGRRAGTHSEARALELVQARLSDIEPEVRVMRVPYAGWRSKSAALRLADGTAVSCNPLLGLQSAGEDYETETSVLSLDLPGQGPEWVVLSAHIDGHDLAESAMDNATGVAAALAVARACARFLRQCHRGLRICLFSAEEWALA